MKLIIFLILIIPLNYNSYCQDNEFPSIQELFNLSKPINSTPWPTIPSYFAPKFQLDIENVDIDKFRRKLSQAQAQVYKPGMDGVVKDNTTISNETRRQQLEYKTGWQWRQTSEHIVKVKVCDLSLQQIYMARRKIKKIQSSKYFNRKDTGYRIAFIYKRLRRLYRRILSIHSSVKRAVWREWWANSDNMRSYHQQTVKLHVDFLYLFWVMVKLDGTYRDRFGLPHYNSPDLNNIKSTKDPFVNYQDDERWFWWDRWRWV